MGHGTRQIGSVSDAARETGENVMMFEEATPAGTVTPYHLHHDSDEITYVLSGQMTFKIATRSPSAGLEQAPSCRVASLTPGRTQGLKPVEHFSCSRRRGGQDFRGPE